MFPFMEYGGQGPPILFYLIVALSLMAATMVGKIAISGYGSPQPAPEYFIYQVADNREHRTEYRTAYATWHGT